MTNIIKASLDTMGKGIDSLKNIRKDKREYKESLKRVDALPEEYRFVYDKITNYMWNNFGGGDGYDMISLQSGLLELFETSAAEGRTVLEVTGSDVAAFCDELLHNTVTYTEKRRKKFNDDIKKKISSEN